MVLGVFHHICILWVNEHLLETLLLLAPRLLCEPSCYRPFEHRRKNRCSDAFCHQQGTVHDMVSWHLWGSWYWFNGTTYRDAVFSYYFCHQYFAIAAVNFQAHCREKSYLYFESLYYEPLPPVLGYICSHDAKRDNVYSIPLTAMKVHLSILKAEGKPVNSF